jgi:predicted ester cyclase
MGNTKDVYERLVRLYNAGDLESLVNSYTEDAILVTPDGTARGRAAIRKQWSRDRAAFPDRTLTIDVIVEQGDTIASEFTWAATNTGPLVQPDGTELSPTGKRIETKGMELVQVREGKVAAHRGYWDTTALAGQLGLLSGAAITAARPSRGIVVHGVSGGAARR